jgi:hypothetical protein
MSATTKYTTINISKWKKAELDKHINGSDQITRWVEKAIDEKIKRERGTCYVVKMKLMYLTKEQAAQLEGGN